jgi:hypothetical protein
VKRTTPILLAAVLALLLAACGADQTATSPTPSPTVEPTPEATPTPTATEAAETDDGSGSGTTGALADALPDSVGGLDREEIPGMGESMEDLIASQLQQQGLDAEEVDFAMAMYGQGELLVTGFSVPGMPQGQLELLAQMMSGMQGEGGENLETETATVGGKEVIRMSVAGETQSVFMYIAGDAVFTVVAESEDLAAELLSQLP